MFRATPAKLASRMTLSTHPYRALGPSVGQFLAPNKGLVVVRGESAGPHVGSDLQPAFRCRLSLDLFFHLFPFVLFFVCLGRMAPTGFFSIVGKLLRRKCEFKKPTPRVASRVLCKS